MKTFLVNLKKILFVIVILAVLFALQNIMHKIKYFIDEDTCVDIGLCSEGLRFGENIMSKEYCLKEGKKWDDRRKQCDMEIESRTCREQGYEWIIEKGKCSHEIIRNW